MAYPTTLDTLTTAIATDPLGTNNTVGLTAIVNGIITAVQSVEAKVGADSSAVTTSHDYKLSGVTGSDKAASKAGSETLTNKTISGASNTVTNLTDGALSLTDVTTNDVSTTKHGFVPKAPNDTTKYLRGDGTWAVNSSTDGWTTSSDTWVYASASTFTIAGADRTAIYTKGTKLKFTQTTAKYAVVVSSSFSTDTTVTIAVNTDYTIANAAITSPYYSYQTNPQGYPTWFTYTPTFTGFSAAPTVIAKYAINGRNVTWYVATTANGTSDATGFTITLPVTASSTARTLIYLVQVVDNSSGPTAPGRLEIGNGSTTATLYKDLNQTVFTASGTKAATFLINYEI